MPSAWLRLLDPEVNALQKASAPSPQSRLLLAKAYNGRCLHREAAEVLDQLLAEKRSDGEAWFERIVATGEHAALEELENLQRELEAVRDENPDRTGRPLSSLDSSACSRIILPRPRTGSSSP